MHSKINIQTGRHADIWGRQRKRETGKKETGEKETGRERDREREIGGEKKRRDTLMGETEKERDRRERDRERERQGEREIYRGREEEKRHLNLELLSFQVDIRTSVLKGLTKVEVHRSRVGDVVHNRRP